MKNEIARREIESLDYYLQNHTNDYSEESHTAMMMAIKALKQEDCEDCISRESVLAIAGDSCLDLNSYEDTKEFCDEIKDLSPVTPQPKTDVLNKIRAEIEQGYCTVNDDFDHGCNYGLYMATQIIDKYKAGEE